MDTGRYVELGLGGVTDWLAGWLAGLEGCLGLGTEPDPRPESDTLAAAAAAATAG